jgi:Ca-activated chloride channel family protein
MKRWPVGAVLLAFLLAPVVVPALWPSTATPAAAAPADLATPGSLNVVVKPGEKLLTCPLEHTDVEGWITGDIAHVRVTQGFSNPYSEPIEAVYVFPLPENSAVNDMVMQIGSRTIRGLIKEREEAKQIYEQAKQAGKTASLLEQERPNIFTQSVANIMPGDPIEITIWYVQDLRYDHGRYEFSFPMVVGPRYIPGSPLPGPDAGGGWSPDTDQVPDASRITPPVLKPDERTGHDISLTLHLDPGVPAQDIWSKAHDIVVDSYTGIPIDITLADHDTIPNKDFDLSWRVATERPEVGVLTYRDDRSGYFMLILQPKADFDPAEITPKEMVFCLDTSGSMSGLPIEKSKEAVKLALQQMGPRDTFQVIRFAGDSSTFAPEPVSATSDNVARALKFVEQMQGGGGTEMLKGIEASLAFPADPNRLRIVAFLTDGYIGNEADILARIQKQLGDARIFSFGIGSSVNRYLLVKMAQMGRGAVQFVRWDENPDLAVGNFVDRIARPYLTDISIDWGGLAVEDIYPSYVPDLFADQPVILHGCYREPGRGLITIRGSIAGRPWETTKEVTLPAEETEHDALASLWARARIEELMDQMFAGEDPEIKAQVIELAIAYRLMSAYTSFVAVEERIVNRDGKPVTVQVPVPMPEGVSYEGVFGKAKFADARAAYAGIGFRGGGGGGGRAARAGGRAAMGAAGHAAPQTRLSRTELESAVSGWIGEGSPAWLVIVGEDGEGLDKQAAGKAAAGLRAAAAAVIGLPAAPPAVVGPDQLANLADAKQVRVVVIAGAETIHFTRDQSEALAKFLRGGGYLIVDSAGDPFYRSVVKELRTLLPEARFARVSVRHPVFRGASMPFSLPDGCPIVGKSETSGPAQGFSLGDRLAVFVSRGGLAQAWAQPRSQANEQAYQMGVNLLAYALQNPPHQDAAR